VQQFSSVAKCSDNSTIECICRFLGSLQEPLYPELHMESPLPKLKSLLQSLSLA